MCLIQPRWCNLWDATHFLILDDWTTICLLGLALVPFWQEFGRYNLATHPPYNSSYLLCLWTTNERSRQVAVVSSSSSSAISSTLLYSIQNANHGQGETSETRKGVRNPEGRVRVQPGPPKPLTTVNVTAAAQLSHSPKNYEKNRFSLWIGNIITF